VVFGKVKTFDAAKALAVAGVEQVVELPAAEAPSMFKAQGGIAVIASNSWAALKARDLLDIEWDDGSNADYNSDNYKQMLLQAVRQPGSVLRQQGDVNQALEAAEQKLEAEFYAPHLAHASMEPPAAVASVTADFCEVWAPTQNHG
jgi:isoquinoline 1-oxidoreductase beta subunit